MTKYKVMDVPAAQGTKAAQLIMDISAAPGTQAAQYIHSKEGQKSKKEKKRKLTKAFGRV